MKRNLFAGTAGGVLLITGISAAGKSTVAQALAERSERSVHLRGDVFRRMVVSGRADMSADPTPEAVAQLRLRHRLSAMAADACREEGFTVVLQDVVLGEHLRELVDAIRSRPLAVVVLAPDAAAVARREQGREKTGYGPQLRPEDLDEVLRHRTPRLGLWLDTAEWSVERTVEEILQRADTEGRIG